jgi:RNA-binding protein
MASVPLHYIDLRAFSYATEDDKRVADALRTFLPEEWESLDRAVTEGYHGDRIVVLSTRVERADDVRNLLDSLTNLDGIEEVIAELDQRVDEDCTFFLTLDKQAALRGEVALGDGITLRGKVEAYPAEKDSAVSNVRGILTSLA